MQVLLDPVGFLVKAATVFLCDLKEQGHRCVQHSWALARDNHNWLKFKSDKILSSRLLSVLWPLAGEHPSEGKDAPSLVVSSVGEREQLEFLLFKFGIICHSGGAACDPLRSVPGEDREYLVPALLPKLDESKLLDPKSTRKSHSLTATLALLPASSKAEEYDYLTEKSLLSRSYLPQSIFDRITGEALARSSASRGRAEQVARNQLWLKFADLPEVVLQLRDKQVLTVHVLGDEQRPTCWPTPDRVLEIGTSKSPCITE